MGEVERRRGYGYNRVLIESERILDPQFNDAVVFLSGAQIEMLRNVTQYLNRLVTYAAEYNLGYYLVPTDEDFDDILEIVADLEETLMGNPNTIWGYKERWFQYIEEYSTGEGETVCVTPAVPEDEVYVLEQWNINHTGGQTCGMIFGVQPSAVSPMIYYAPAVPSGDWVMESARLTLGPGDILSLRVIALPDETRCLIRVSGYKMEILE